MELEDDIDVEQDIKNMKNLYGKLEQMVNNKISPRNKENKVESGTKKKKRIALSQDEIKEKKVNSLDDNCKDNKITTNEKVIQGKNKRNVNACTIESIQTNHETLNLNYLTVESKENNIPIKTEIDNEKIEKKLLLKEKLDVNKGLYLRSLQHKQVTAEKIEKKRIEEEEKRLAALQKAPVINEKSKKILAKKDKGEKSFFERLEQNKQENEKKRLKILAEQEEKILKEKEEMEQKKVKKDKTVIDEKVNKLLDWNNKKEKKIVEKKKEVQKEEEKFCTFKPEINKTSEKISQKDLGYYTEKAVSERLYEDDVAKRKEKIKMLESIYTHTFTPITNSTVEGRDQREKKKELKNGDKTKTGNESYQKFQNDEQLSARR